MMGDSTETAKGGTEHPVPEYGNDVACDNCGNEWGEMFDHDGLSTLCQECHDEYEASNAG